MRLLVLSGGGSKGAFQLGVLLRLLFDGTCHYDAIFGVSTGALTGSLLAHGSTAWEQHERLAELLLLYGNIKGNRDIYRGGGNVVSKLWNLWRKGGIYDPAPLKRLVERHVDPFVLAHSTTHFEAGYTDLQSGAYLTADGTHPFIQRFILASAFQPVFFQLFAPLADGGVRVQTPLGSAFAWLKNTGLSWQKEAGHSIDVIVCNPVGQMPPETIDYRSASQVLRRTFDIIENAAFLSDIKRALKKNLHPDADDLYAQIHLYAPAFDLGDGLNFSPSMIDSNVTIGWNTPEDRMTCVHESIPENVGDSAALACDRL